MSKSNEPNNPAKVLKANNGAGVDGEKVPLEGANLGDKERAYALFEKYKKEGDVQKAGLTAAYICIKFGDPGDIATHEDLKYYINKSSVGMRRTRPFKEQAQKTPAPVQTLPSAQKTPGTAIPTANPDLSQRTRFPTGTPVRTGPLPTRTPTPTWTPRRPNNPIPAVAPDPNEVVPTFSKLSQETQARARKALQTVYSGKTDEERLGAIDYLRGLGVGDIRILKEGAALGDKACAYALFERYKKDGDIHMAGLTAVFILCIFGDPHDIKTMDDLEHYINESGVGMTRTRRYQKQTQDAIAAIKDAQSKKQTDLGVSAVIRTLQQGLEEKQPKRDPIRHQKRFWQMYTVLKCDDEEV